MQQEEENEEMLQQGGIPIHLISHSPINIDFLICPICFNILWKPIACSQDRCFSSFCECCINSWLQMNQNENSMALQYANQISTHMENQISEESDEMEFYQKNGDCPKCKRTFIKTEIPIILTLLKQLKVKCINQGCDDIVDYCDYDLHIKNCANRKKKCSGCNKHYLLSEIGSHESQCQEVQTQCQVCKYSMTKQNFKENHNKYNCITNQFTKQDELLIDIIEKINFIEQNINYNELKLHKLTVGELERIIEYKFSTIFTINYQFTNDNLYIARLFRNSFNYAKQKNDFLHFYMDQSIPINLQGFEWKIRIIRLRGALLIGICSSQQPTSIDFIINRLGEIKRKDANDNKYQNTRKVHFSFGEGDIIQFQYLPLLGCVRVKNESRHLIFAFEKQEMQQMCEEFYSFFSLEYQGDAIQFL